MPFNGELMRCSLCGAQQQHDPSEENDWRVIQFSGEDEVYYVCPIHFPPDGARVDDFKHAYLAVVTELVERHKWSRTQLVDVLIGLNLS